MDNEQEGLLKSLNNILNIFKSSDAEIRPHFVLTGPSGSGKTFTVHQLADQHELNFIEINAAQLTKEGTAGNSLSKALTPLREAQNRLTVCFVDEFDKLFISGNCNSDLAHETTNGVQNEFLKVLESDTTSVFGEFGKYVNISCKNVLFIFGGAFNGEEDITIDRLRELGIKTEFLGRVGLVYNVVKPSLKKLLRTLKDSKILANYLKLFPDVKKSDVLQTIGSYIEANYDNNTLGYRMINTLINQYFILGGKLDDQVAESSTFQKTLTLN